MTLQQIKEETAKKWGFPSWDDYVTTRPIYDHVCELYAESKVKERDERIKELEKVLVKVREYLRLKDLLPTLKYETNETIDAAYNQFLKVDQSLRKEIKLFTKTKP